MLSVRAAVAAVPLLNFKMDEYPDLDDEFEALHAEEMAVMRELEGKGVCGVHGERRD